MEEKCIRMANIICHVVETVAVCAVIAILGWKILGAFEKSIVMSKPDSEVVGEQQSQKGNK